MGATQISMSVNSSFTSHCYDSMAAHYISQAFCLVKLLLVTPSAALVLFLGVRRWRRQQQGRLPPASPSDVFTYHVSVFELTNLFGYVLFFWGEFAGLTKMEVAAEVVLNFTFFDPLVFHMLACLDRYLAVVYPITYLWLRQSAGIRIQIIIPVCVWLLSSTLGTLGFFQAEFHSVLLSVLLAIFLVTISTFSIHILCVLKHAGPDGIGVREDRGKVSQSRQRAAHMVMAIAGTHWMWFFGILLSIILMDSSLRSEKYGCLAILAGFWFSLPSILILPLLYLRKAGKWK